MYISSVSLLFTEVFFMWYCKRTFYNQDYIVDIDNMIISTEVLYQLQGGRCFYCGSKISFGSYDKFVRSNGKTKDHLIPKCEGVTFSNNLVLACHDCNAKKRNKTPSNKALKKYEFLTILLRRYPDVSKKELHKLHRWLLLYF